MVATLQQTNDTQGERLMRMNMDGSDNALDNRILSGLKSFVNTIRSNLWSREKHQALCPGTIESARLLENRFNRWGSEKPHPNGGEDIGNHLFMDYLMHHRVGLAAEIVKSMANGRQLSKSSEKVLKNSIEYIEQRL